MSDVAQGPWSDTELDLIVADYLDMLRLELAGESFSKKERRNALKQLIARNDGSIEFKHQNISAVLHDLGLPWINGYKPRSNYQAALAPAIERALPALEPIADAPATSPPTPTDIFVAPPEKTAPTSSTPAFNRLARKFDPASRDARHRQLGKAGEELIFKFECDRLMRIERPHLAMKMRWVSAEDGDGAGYDIYSFDEHGHERLVEVKTTRGSERTPFYLTRNELALSDERTDAFVLVRLFDFSVAPRAYELRPPLAQHLHLEPTTYRAWR